MQVAVWQAGPLWKACVMRALRIVDGWMPLTAWAPSRTPDVTQALEECVAGPPPAALSVDEWRGLGGQARAVLARGHQQQPACVSGVDGTSHTVHGDARLPNIMARRDSNSTSGFQVLFVDFGWAGVAGRSRYDA